MNNPFSDAFIIGSAVEKSDSCIPFKKGKNDCRYFTQANNLCGSGQLDKAEVAYRKAIAKTPRNP